MALVTASCPKCQTVRIDSSEVVLVETPVGLRYAFLCPSMCGDTVNPAASPAVARALYWTGVRVTSYPQELVELHDGPALTADDVLAFHNALCDPANAL